MNETHFPGSLRHNNTWSDSSFSSTSRLSEASDITFTVNNSNNTFNGIDASSPSSVISTNELSRSQIMAVQAPHDDQESSFDPPSKNAFHPKKVHATSASNSNSPNDLNHNGLNKNLSSSSPTTPASQQEAEESFESAVTTEQEQ